MKILVHRVPLCVKNDKLVESGELNSPEFDFKGHFAKETIVTLGRFMVCYKAKPWMINDLMIIDGDKEYVKSPSELDEEDSNILNSIINIAIAELSSNSQISKIVVGANINPLPEKEDHESIWRLHVHVCGLTKGEVEKMEILDEETNIYEDEIIEQFKKEIAQLDGFEEYAYGARKDLENIKDGNFMDEIKYIDIKVKEILSKFVSKFSVISYSFSIIIEDDRASMYVSPKSRDGRGVLEAVGIILDREENLEIDKDFIDGRNKFLKRVQDKLIQIDGAKIGKLKLEE